MPMWGVVAIVVASVVAYIVIGGVWAGIARRRGVDWIDPSLVYGAAFWPAALFVLIGYYIARRIGDTPKEKSLKDRVGNLECTRREHREDIQGNANALNMHSGNRQLHKTEEDSVFSATLLARVVHLEDLHKTVSKKAKKGKGKK